jgi:membrane fusion protein (multidrug efflux system)
MLLIARVLWGAFGFDAADKKATGTLVEALTLTPQPLEITLEAVASIRAENAIILRPEITGVVETIHFTEGKAVPMGAPLITLDQRLAKGDLAAAQAAVSLAETNYKRADNLIRSAAGSERVRDEAEAQRRTARANLEQAQARLDKTELRAPFAGIPGLRRVSLGEYVQPGKDLVSFTALEPLNVDFSVPENAAGQVSVGQSVTVRVDAVPGKVWTASVIAVDPQIDARTRALAVRARLTDTGGAVQSGMFARAVLVTGRRDDALLVPEEALIPQGDRAAVLLINADGKLERKAVVSGARQGTLVEVREGLSAGQKIVISGQNKLRPGQAVQVKP